MSGFVAAYREAVDHPLFMGNAERLGAWMWLVMKAAWKPTPYDIAGKIVTIERGQVCVSRSQLSKAWGMSPSGVERFLTRLKTEQMIEQATGQGRSIITICNYSKYQDISDDAGQATGQATGQPSDSHRTTKEQGNKGTRDTNVSQDASASPEKPKVSTAEIDEAIECYRLGAEKAKWPIPIKIDPARRSKLSSRLKENGIEGWKDALRRAIRSEQLGHDPPSWFTFDWLIKNSGNILKVLEGNYDKRFGSNSVAATPIAKPGTTGEAARRIRERLSAQAVSQDELFGVASDGGQRLVLPAK